MRTRNSNRFTKLLTALVLIGLSVTLGASGTVADLESEQQQRLATGEISVVAAVRSANPRIGEVVTYVFRRNAHDEIVAAMRAGERATVAAGNYDLRAVLKLESEERDVQWLRGVTVIAGEHTELRVSFTRGTLLVHVQNAGEPLPGEAVSISVYRAGDEQEELIDLGLADEPLDLAPGRYDVKATFIHSNDRPVRWLRGLELRPDEVTESTVEFASGTVAIGATWNGGSPVGAHAVYIYYYGTTDHAQPIAYTPSGAPAVFEAGSYDIRAHFVRSHDQPDTWLRGVVVRPGHVTVRSVAFPSAELMVRVRDASGSEIVGDNAFVYVYPAGERSLPIASARSGENLILTEGVYDVRVEDTRRPGADVWLPSIRLQTGTPTIRDLEIGVAAVLNR
jgi:hypothetical protein